MGKRAKKEREDRIKKREEKRNQNKGKKQKSYNEEEKIENKEKLSNGIIYPEEIEEFRRKRGIELEKDKNPKITDEDAKMEIRKTQETKREEFLKGCIFSSSNERRQKLKEKWIDPEKERKIAKRLEGERKDIYLKVVLKKLEEANIQEDQEER